MIWALAILAITVAVLTWNRKRKSEAPTIAFTISLLYVHHHQMVEFSIIKDQHIKTLRLVSKLH
jgi:hypothetical protein